MHYAPGSPNGNSNFVKGRRSSAPNSATQQGYASSYLWTSALKIAGRAVAEDAQRKINARRAKRDESPHANRKYAPELVAEAKAMRAQGWPPREIARVTGIPITSMHSVLYNSADGLSAAKAKGYFKK